MSESIVHSRNATIRIHFFKLRGFKFGVYWFTILLILSFANSFLNSPSILGIRYWFTIFSRIYYRFTFYFANWLSMHYWFWSLSISLSISGIYIELTIQSVNSPMIHYFLANTFRIHYLFREFINDLLSFFANSR